MTVKLFEGDNRETLKRMIAEGTRVHAVVTDPPYGLTSIQKRFGTQGAKAARQDGNDGSFARLSAGFMGKAWDGSGIEKDPDFWKLIYDILLPGGYVFAFSGARTGHWQACAMELAGFIMHPMHGWAFGQGFPKAHAADKAIDKALGKKGEIVATGDPVKRMIPGADQHKTGSWEKNNGREYQPGEYVPATDEAAEWAGWAYGTQSQKPALEPIYLAQKPFAEKTGAKNLLKYGVGAVNIDGCRVPSEPRTYDLKGGENLNQIARNGGNDSADARGIGAYGVGAKQVSIGQVTVEGRHPANLLHDGSPEVIAMFPDSKGQLAKASVDQTARENQNCYGAMARGKNGSEPRGDSGSAARFFHAFPFTDDDYRHLTSAPALFYNGKAGKIDRAGSRHPTVKPIALMQNLIRHITPPGGIVLDPFAGSGTTGVAAEIEGFECWLMEAEPEYIEFLRNRFNLDTPADDDLFGDLLGAGSTECGEDDLFGDLL